MRIVIDVLIVISILFSIAGMIGMIRMPDAYTRMQSSTNISTLGLLGVLIAGILYSIIYLKDTSMAIKLAVLIVFYLGTNPIGGHAIAKAAYRAKVKPSEKTVCDHYGADLEEVSEDE